MKPWRNMAMISCTLWRSSWKSAPRRERKQQVSCTPSSKSSSRPFRPCTTSEPRARKWAQKRPRFNQYVLGTLSVRVLLLSLEVQENPELHLKSRPACQPSRETERSRELCRSMSPETAHLKKQGSTRGRVERRMGWRGGVLSGAKAGRQQIDLSGRPRHVEGKRNHFEVQLLHFHITCLSCEFLSSNVCVGGRGVANAYLKSLSGWKWKHLKSLVPSSKIHIHFFQLSGPRIRREDDKPGGALHDHTMAHCFYSLPSNSCQGRCIFSFF